MTSHLDTIVGNILDNVKPVESDDEINVPRFIVELVETLQEKGVENPQIKRDSIVSYIDKRAPGIENIELNIDISMKYLMNKKLGISHYDSELDPSYVMPSSKSLIDAIEPVNLDEVVKAIIEVTEPDKTKIGPPRIFIYDFLMILLNMGVKPKEYLERQWFIEYIQKRTQLDDKKTGQRFNSGANFFRRHHLKDFAKKKNGRFEFTLPQRDDIVEIWKQIKAKKEPYRKPGDDVADRIYGYIPEILRINALPANVHELRGILTEAYGFTAEDCKSYFNGTLKSLVEDGWVQKSKHVEIKRGYTTIYGYVYNVSENTLIGDDGIIPCELYLKMMIDLTAKRRKGSRIAYVVKNLNKDDLTKEKIMPMLELMEQSGLIMDLDEKGFTLTEEAIECYSYK